MTSDARKRAWLAKIGPPEGDGTLSGWAYVWRFNGAVADYDHQMCLCLIRESLAFEVYILRTFPNAGKRQSSNPRLSRILRSRLTNEQLAAGLAAIITCNHAQGT